jgi:hypothetical protein
MELIVEAEAQGSVPGDFHFDYWCKHGYDPTLEGWAGNIETRFPGAIQALDPENPTHAEVWAGLVRHFGRGMPKPEFPDTFHPDSHTLFEKIFKRPWNEDYFTYLEQLISLKHQMRAMLVKAFQAFPDHLPSKPWKYQLMRRPAEPSNYLVNPRTGQTSIGGKGFKRDPNRRFQRIPAHGSVAGVAPLSPLWDKLTPIKVTLYHVLIILYHKAYYNHLRYDDYPFDQMKWPDCPELPGGLYDFKILQKAIWDYKRPDDCLPLPNKFSQIRNPRGKQKKS